MKRYQHALRLLLIVALFASNGLVAWIWTQSKHLERQIAQVEQGVQQTHRLTQALTQILKGNFSTVGDLTATHGALSKDLMTLQERLSSPLTTATLYQEVQPKLQNVVTSVERMRLAITTLVAQHNSPSESPFPEEARVQPEKQSVDGTPSDAPLPSTKNTNAVRDASVMLLSELEAQRAQLRALQEVFAKHPAMNHVTLVVLSITGVLTALSVIGLLVMQIFVMRQSNPPSKNPSNQPVVQDEEKSLAPSHDSALAIATAPDPSLHSTTPISTAASTFQSSESTTLVSPPQGVPAPSADTSATVTKNQRVEAVPLAVHQIPTLVNVVSHSAFLKEEALLQMVDRLAVPAQDLEGATKQFHLTINQQLIDLHQVGQAAQAMAERLHQSVALAGELAHIYNQMLLTSHEGLKTAQQDPQLSPQTAEKIELALGEVERMSHHIANLIQHMTTTTIDEAREARVIATTTQDVFASTERLGQQARLNGERAAECLLAANQLRQATLAARKE